MTELQQARIEAVRVAVLEAREAAAWVAYTAAIARGAGIDADLIAMALEARR